MYLFPPLPLPTLDVLITRELWPAWRQAAVGEGCIHPTMVLRRNTFQSLLSPYSLTVSINPHFTDEETDTEGQSLAQNPNPCQKQGHSPKAAQHLTLLNMYLVNSK